MTGFQLDTSGSVRRPGFARPLVWSDLSEFEQGYIEALFGGPWEKVNVELRRAGAIAGRDNARRVDVLGFSDLASETLALILNDCERYEQQTGGAPPSEPYWGMTKEMGEEFFRRRLFERWPDFPPQTPTLADDGKVYLRQAQEAQS